MDDNDLKIYSTNLRFRQIDALRALREETRATVAELIREAVDDLLDKYAAKRTPNA